MGFLIMKSKLREGFVPELKDLAIRYASLNLTLSLNYAFNIQLEEQKQIIARVIKPLFDSSHGAYLYDDGENFELQDKLNAILFKKGKKFHFDLQKNIFEDFEKFWGNDNESRGSIIWENDVNNIDLSSVLKHTYDPFVLTNLGATLSRSAITIAKKAVASDQTKIAFGLSPSGLKWLTIFVNEARMASLVDLAFDHCQLSASFLKLYGPRNGV